MLRWSVDDGDPHSAASLGQFRTGIRVDQLPRKGDAGGGASHVPPRRAARRLREMGEGTCGGSRCGIGSSVSRWPLLRGAGSPAGHSGAAARARPSLRGLVRSAPASPWASSDRSLLPSTGDEPALRGDAAQREHRRVGRQHRQLPAGGNERESAVERAFEVRLDEATPSARDRRRAAARPARPRGRRTRPSSARPRAGARGRCPRSTTRPCRRRSRR